MSEFDQPSVTAPESASAAAPAGTPAVLLVDDQPARLLTYESILQGVGVTCVRATSGRDALAALLRQSFALILLDVSMPEMDGYETARLVREHPRFERTPIIFITGVHVSELDTLKGYEAGAIDYISVPIVPEILRSKVALLVELYRRRTELETLNREITLRMQAEREAQRALSADRAEREWLAAVLNSMNEEVYFADPQKRYTYANPAAIREFGRLVDGMEVEKIVTALEVLRADGTPRPLEEAPPLRALKGEIIRGEEQMVRIPRTGELRHRQVSSAPVRNAKGEIIGSVSVVRDITEQRRSDAALRSRDARSTVLLKLGDELRTLTTPGELAFAAAKVLGETLNVSRCGYGTIDLNAETISIENDWHPPGIQSIAGVLHFREYGTYIDDLKRGETVVCVDTERDLRTAATADALRTLNVRSFVNMPITEPEGVVALFFLNHAEPREWTPDDLSLMREIAERTRIAVERRRHEQALAAELIERTRAEQALRKSEMELRDADRRKDEFIAILAHELRNPLVPIRTGVELLKRADEHPRLIDSVRPMMERQVSHMVRLIDDLLDVSRITSGKIELQRQQVTLSSVVDSAIEANRAAISAGRFDLMVNLVEPHRMLNVDPTRFSQVISNLLQNAAKFTSPGGRIAITACIESGGDSQAPELVLRVSDSGIGIPAAALPRIFELFAQANSNHKAVQGGLGIGLALARRLMELHGGTLDARSEGEGTGSEFIIRLPAAEAADDSGSSASPRADSLQGMRLLVIDDNQDAANIMGLLIEGMGGSAHVAYDGMSALRAIPDFRPQVVLLDIGMPGMDGYETCREIRRQFGERLAVVALSGWGQEQHKRNATRAGFDAHLTKPADPVRLQTLILELARRSAPLARDP